MTCYLLSWINVNARQSMCVHYNSLNSWSMPFYVRKCENGDHCHGHGISLCRNERIQRVSNSTNHSKLEIFFAIFPVTAAKLLKFMRNNSMDCGNCTVDSLNNLWSLWITDACTLTKLKWETRFQTGTLHLNYEHKPHFTHLQHLGVHFWLERCCTVIYISKSFDLNVETTWCARTFFHMI